MVINAIAGNHNVNLVCRHRGSHLPAGRATALYRKGGLEPFNRMCLVPLCKSRCQRHRWPDSALQREVEWSSRTEKS